jgi:hypothetical protein
MGAMNAKALLFTRVFMAATAVLSLGCLIAGALLWRPSGVGAVRDAQRRWIANPAPHYRLQVSETYRLAYLEGRCTQDIEVKGESVVAVAHNSCPSPPQTVTSLFTQMSDLEPVMCINFGCACDFVGEVQAEYDQRASTPQRVIIRWTSTPNWRHPDFWRAAWQLGTLPRCSPATTSVDRTLIVTLTPLP